MNFSHINVYYINTFNSKLNQQNNNLKILFNFERNFNQQKNKQFSAEALNFRYHYKKIQAQKKSEFKNQLENKAIQYFELSEKFAFLAEQLKDSLNLFQGKIKVDLFSAITKQIYLRNQEIKHLIALSNSDVNKESHQEFHIGFHFTCLFNSASKKLGILEVNTDLVDSVEEYMEKDNRLVFEYNPNIKNFCFKTINIEFLRELKYNFNDLKGEVITSIFPFYLLSEKLKKLLFHMNCDAKENFKEKLLVFDANREIKYLEFSFKILININLKILLYGKYTSLD